MQSDIDYKLFDIVNVNLIHRNHFFDLILKPKSVKEKFINGEFNPLFFKLRPGIIIRKFINKVDPSKTWFLVIPLTSKTSAIDWIGAMNAIRIPFIHRSFDYRKSYLMLDHMQCMTTNQITCIYTNKRGNRVRLTSGQKVYLKYNINNKLGKIVV